MSGLPDCCTPDHGPECWCKQGYAAGLDAAREAVANLPVALVAVRDSKHLNTQGMRPCEEPDDYPHGLVQVSAMAAIDALRTTR